MKTDYEVSINQLLHALCRAIRIQQDEPIMQVVNDKTGLYFLTKSHQRLDILSATSAIDIKF